MAISLFANDNATPTHSVRLPYETGYIDPLVNELRVLPQPIVSSQSIVLFEASTGSILFQKNADIAIPPASLTKLVVMALALDYLQSKQISLNNAVDIHPEAWAKNMPVRSSLMFLGPRQNCTWQDLLLGLAVDSGNDAALEIALQISGNEAAFVQAMNDYCQKLGMKSTHFVEPSGYDEHNITNARDFSYFIWNYLNFHPQSIELYHSIRQFTYPHDDGNKSISQTNRNRLLFDYPGADGLKTGYIDESGYNLAFTAQRDGMRLAGVVLGGINEAQRFNDAVGLLNYGFDQYTVKTLYYKDIQSIRIWNGSQAIIRLPDGNCKIVLPRSLADDLTAQIKQYHEIEGPLAADAVVAWVHYQNSAGKTLAVLPIRSGVEIQETNFLSNWAEKIYLGIRSLIGHPWPKKIGQTLN